MLGHGDPLERGVVRAMTTLGVVAAILVPGVARAQGANDAAAAEALFNEGKRLMTTGKLTAACPKFAESQRLDPGIGTMLWLADCYRQNGQTASAWAVFREAEGLAVKQQDPRVKIAREEALKLEPKLSKLLIEVPPATEVEGLEIKRDGVVVGKPLWGSPMPTDPGPHRVTATAPQRKPWASNVDVPKDSRSSSITVPALEPAPPEVVAPPGGEGAAGSTGTGNTQRIVGLVVGGVGVVALGFGAYFGLRTKSKNDESSSHCGANNVCDDTGFTARKDALSAATISNVAFVVGGVAVAGGIVLYFTAPKSGASALAVGPRVSATAQECVISGTF